MSARTIIAECPFCQATVVKLMKLGAFYFVRCDGCGSCGPRNANWESAVKHWNNFYWEDEAIKSETISLGEAQNKPLVVSRPLSKLKN